MHMYNTNGIWIIGKEHELGREDMLRRMSEDLEGVSGGYLIVCGQEILKNKSKKKILIKSIISSC